MTSSGARRLADLGAAVTDGAAIDWDAEIQSAPQLARRLTRLRQLEAIGSVHRSLAETDSTKPAVPSDPAVPEADEHGALRCPFRWGHLTVLEQVGRGTFGDVYRAVDSRLLREVALKLRELPSSMEGGSARRFLDEARGLARVRHLNVVVVYGADVHAGRIGFWMEFIHGRSLANRLGERGPLGEREAILAGIDLCRALAAVHAAGLVHGDVKAANVMEEETGRLVLMDFGASSVWAARARAGEGGRSVVGTPLAMSPEVLAGEAPQPASDLYGLAVLLHQLVSGSYPVSAGTLTELRAKHARAERTPLHELRPDLSPAFTQVIERALDRDPELRFPGAAEMEMALRAAMGGPAERGHRLPAEPDVLIGREDDLAAVVREIERGARLVTLVGPGGIGKTRLAMGYGWQHLPTWPGGVWFCDLTEARDLDGVVGAMAVGLDVPLSKGDPVEQLGNAILGRGRCLVILDNLEQVMEHVRPVISRWLSRAPDGRFVVTSRARVNVPGEVLLEVEPLSIESGIELFLARARGQGAEIGRDGPMGESVRQVVECVEGIPLAIELAAARVRVMTPEQIAGRMRDRFRILGTSGERSDAADRRHATLRAAIDGSWELLQPWEKSAFAQCSVFQGGFTLDAAEAVLDLSAWHDAPWAVDVVQSLVDKTLLRASGFEPASGSTGQDVRFSMYVSLQEYAALKLRAAAELALDAGAVAAERLAEERHGKWYARYGTDEAIEASRQQIRLERELENLMAACRRAVLRGDADTAVKTYRASWRVLELRGPFATGVELGRQLAELPLKEADRTRFLRTLGLAEWYAGRMKEAVDHLEMALGIAQELGNSSAELGILSSLGGLYLRCGEIEKAGQRLEKGLTIARAIGKRAIESNILSALGVLHRDQGRMDKARACYETALAIARENGDRRIEGTAMSNLALLNQDQGRKEEARTQHETALAIHREVGNRSLEGIVLGNLGNLHYEQGRLDEARATYEAALAVTRAVGNRSFEGVGLINLGKVDWDQGRIDEALHHHELGLAIIREVGQRRYEGAVLGDLATLYYGQGRVEEAWEALRAGEPILRQLGDSLEIGKFLLKRAEIEHRSGNESAALTTFAEAESLAAEVEAGPDSGFGQELTKVRQLLFRGF